MLTRPDYTHHHLYELMEKLGYKVKLEEQTEVGICKGFQEMWVQAVLCGERKQFEDRINWLFNVSTEALNQKMTALNNKQGSELTAEEQMLVDVLATFDGIALFLRPEAFQSFLGESLAQSDNLTISEKIKSKALEQKGGLHKLFDRPYITNHKFLDTVLKDIAATINQCLQNENVTDDDIVISIGSRKHVIGVRFIKASQQWELVDTNKLPWEAIAQDEIALEIMDSFINEKDLPPGTDIKEDHIYCQLDIEILTSGQKKDILSPYFTKLQDAYVATPDMKTATSVDGLTLPRFAAMTGHIDILNNLIEKDGLDVNQKFVGGDTLAHYAARSKQIKVLEFLAEKKADLNVANSSSIFPAVSAFAFDDMNFLKFFIDHGIDITKKSAEGITLVGIAVIKGSLPALKYFDSLSLDFKQHDFAQSPLAIIAAAKGDLDILQFLAEKDINLNAVDNEANTPLHAACQCNHLEVVKYLIENKNKFQIDINQANKNGLTPVHLACEHTPVAILSYLAENGANLNALDSFAQPPSMIALKKSNLDALVVLANHGVNLKDLGKDTEVIALAINNNNLPALTLFADQGLDLEGLNVDGKAPLHRAVMLNKIDMLTFIVDRMTDPNLPDASGQTALHLAVQSNNLKALKILLEQPNIDINLLNANGNAALHLAAKGGNVEIIKLLLAHGANPNLKDARGNTMTHIIFDPQYERKSILNTLMGSTDINWKKFDTGIKNSHGETAIHLAAAGANLTALKLFVSIGANLNITDDQGNTAAHLLALTNNIDGRLEAFAKMPRIDWTRANAKGMTPLHNAASFTEGEEGLKILSKVPQLDWNQPDVDGKTPIYHALQKAKVESVFGDDEEITTTTIEYMCTKGADLMQAGLVAACKGDTKVLNILEQVLSQADANEVYQQLMQLGQSPQFQQLLSVVQDVMQSSENALLKRHVSTGFRDICHQLMNVASSEDYQQLLKYMDNQANKWTSQLQAPIPSNDVGKSMRFLSNQPVSQDDTATPAQQNIQNLLK